MYVYGWVACSTAFKLYQTDSRGIDKFVRVGGLGSCYVQQNLQTEDTLGP